MTPLRQRMIEDLQLHGLATKTQDAYLRAVKQLAEHYHKSPDLITEEELRLYFLYLKNDKHVSPQHVHHCVVRPEVLLPTHASARVGHIGTGSSDP